MKAKDGKLRETDILNTKGILRLIESIPSSKAEPFKLWLAQMGNERIDEIFDPEIAIKRAINYYIDRGYSDEWIERRLKGILDRNKLTDLGEVATRELARKHRPYGLKENKKVAKD